MTDNQYHLLNIDICPKDRYSFIVNGEECEDCGLDYLHNLVMCLCNEIKNHDEEEIASIQSLMMEWLNKYPQAINARTKNERMTPFMLFLCNYGPLEPTIFNSDDLENNIKFFVSLHSDDDLRDIKYVYDLFHCAYFLSNDENENNHLKPKMYSLMTRLKDINIDIYAPIHGHKNILYLLTQNQFVWIFVSLVKHFPEIVDRSMLIYMCINNPFDDKSLRFLCSDAKKLKQDLFISDGVVTRTVLDMFKASLEKYNYDLGHYAETVKALTDVTKTITLADKKEEKKPVDETQKNLSSSLPNLPLYSMNKITISNSAHKNTLVSVHVPKSLDISEVENDMCNILHSLVSQWYKNPLRMKQAFTLIATRFPHFLNEKTKYIMNLTPLMMSFHHADCHLVYDIASTILGFKSVDVNVQDDYGQKTALMHLLHEATLFRWWEQDREMFCKILNLFCNTRFHIDLALRDSSNRDAFDTCSAELKDIVADYFYDISGDVRYKNWFSDGDEKEKMSETVDAVFMKKMKDKYGDDSDIFKTKIPDLHKSFSCNSVVSCAGFKLIHAMVKDFFDKLATVEQNHALFDAIESYLEMDPEAVNDTNDLGYTPLMLACDYACSCDSSEKNNTYKYYDLIALLLSVDGIDVNIQNYFGQTALMIVCMMKDPSYQRNSAFIVSSFIMHSIVTDPNDDSLVKIRYLIDMNKSDFFGDTTLMLCAHYSCISLLLNIDARCLTEPIDLNKQNSRGQTVFMIYYKKMHLFKHDILHEVMTIREKNKSVFSDINLVLYDNDYEILLNYALRLSSGSLMCCCKKSILFLIDNTPIESINGISPKNNSHSIIWQMCAKIYTCAHSFYIEIIERLLDHKDLVIDRKEYNVIKNRSMTALDFILNAEGVVGSIRCQMCFRFINHPNFSEEMINDKEGLDAIMNKNFIRKSTGSYYFKVLCEKKKLKRIDSCDRSSRQ